MEQFHWTQKQLYEENTMHQMHLISEYNTLKNKRAEAEERKAKSKSHQGGRFR